MAFSFIRKMIAPNAATQTSAHPELASVEAETGFDLSQLSIEVVDNDSALTPAQEEAAMLHANGQTVAAAQLLYAELNNIRGLRQTEAWLMLFELLQQTNNKQQFDEVALQFVLEFEKTPPSWQAAAVQQHKEAKHYYAFPATLNHNNIDKEIQGFQAALQSNSSLQMDMSKIREIDSIAAAELLAACESWLKKGAHLQLLGSENIETLLQSRIQTGRRLPAEAPWWLLLIELQQIQGLQEQFENLAIDYAITFEVSPPSWIELDSPPSPHPVAVIKPRAADRFYLESNLVSSQPGQIEEIRSYILQQPFPVLDFSAVQQVDFDSAGQLLGLCMEKPQQITCCNVNALVLALFRIMGITELVIFSS